MPPLAGLGICRSEVAMVELSRAGDGRLHLERYARESLPEGVIATDGIDQLRQVVATVRRLWNKSGSAARRIAISVPSNVATTYILEAAADSSDEQLETLVKQHAAQALPFALEQALLDFSVIGPSQSRSGRIDVLVAAARKEDVDDRIAVAESLGLKTLIVDIDHYALLAALQRCHGKPGAAPAMIFLFLDTGGVHATLINNGCIGGDRFDAVTNESTQRHPMQGYRLPQDQDADADMPQAHCHDLATHCAQSVQSLRACAPHIRHIETVLLAGPGATVSGLASAIETQTNIPTTTATPFAGMSIAADIDPLQMAADAPACAVACGLALRRFDR